ncbi:MAG TPA: DUF3551 domain-containing protein [Xanthobacteraceae bacterium]|nr:DUF3551 domain-containing protein [Xanthobacteraceae bacterium]
MLRMTTAAAMMTLGATLGSAGPATAAGGPTYPWCTTGAAQEFGARNCGFVSFEQCLESARGNGQFCEQNPAYSPPAAKAARRGRQKRTQRSH